MSGGTSRQLPSPLSNSTWIRIAMAAMAFDFESLEPRTVRNGSVQKWEDTQDISHFYGETE